jgi:hypothetical protein
MFRHVSSAIFMALLFKSHREELLCRPAAYCEGAPPRSVCMILPALQQLCSLGVGHIEHMRKLMPQFQSFSRLFCYLWPSGFGESRFDISEVLIRRALIIWRALFGAKDRQSIIESLNLTHPWRNSQIAFHIHVPSSKKTRTLMFDFFHIFAVRRIFELTCANCSTAFRTLTLSSKIHSLFATYISTLWHGVRAHRDLDAYSAVVVLV